MLCISSRRCSTQHPSLAPVGIRNLCFWIRKLKTSFLKWFPSWLPDLNPLFCWHSSTKCSNQINLVKMVPVKLPAVAGLQRYNHRNENVSHITDESLAADEDWRTVCFPHNRFWTCKLCWAQCYFQKYDTSCVIKYGCFVLDNSPIRKRPLHAYNIGGRPCRLSGLRCQPLKVAAILFASRTRWQQPPHNQQPPPPPLWVMCEFGGPAKSIEGKNAPKYQGGGHL